MLFVIILLPLLIGTTLVWWLDKISRTVTAIGATAIAATCFGLLASYIPEIQSQTTIAYTLPWLPSLGINLDFKLDALALMFAMLISGIGILIFIYTYFYLSAKNSLAKLYSLLMLFMAAMLGIALSNNLMLLLVFWELTSISSFLLVGYWQRYEAAQRGSRMALTITGLGGLCMLGGFILIGQVAGTYQIDQLYAKAELIQSSPLFLPILVLILMGAFTKSAQFPFHFWLPNAMAAPTPVSAYLHSATMVKAGIFLLLRLSPIFIGAVYYHEIVTVVGLITLCMGAFFAIFRDDLKGLLAYSTISHLGLIVCLIGIGTPLSIAAAVFHILNHATFKAALFMIAGIIDHETGTRDLRKLSGAWQFLPITATLTMVACAAMAGVPFTNGFISKEMFFTELLANRSGTVLLTLIVFGTLAGIFAVAYSLRMVHGVFFDAKHGKKLPKSDIHDPPAGMLAPVVLLAILCIVVGILPAFFAEHIVNQVTSSALQLPYSAHVHLAIWHGVNTPLIMSLFALAGGAMLYFVLAKNGRIRKLDLDDVLGRIRGVILFDLFLKYLLLGSHWLKKKTETSSLQNYLFIIICFSILMSVIPLYGYQLDKGTQELLHAPAVAIMLWALVLASCAMMLWFHHERIKAVLISGAIGLVVTVTFLTLSAPDLALTQITVDAVTTVILLMSLSLLPQLTPYESTRARRWRDAIIAIISGLGIGWLSWLVMTREHQSISWFFMQQSLPLGGGSNVVNVILVDFRGFDTFGEIAVLGIAAVGALCMMDGMRAHGTTMTRGLTYRFNSSPLMYRVSMSWVLPVALLVSMYIFMRGHNLSGGGFIAGLITAMALIIQYLAYGQDRTERLLRADSGRLYEKWIGIGLTIAGLTGLCAWFWGRPFLTSAHVYVDPLIISDVHLSSALMFDIGVYVTVVGAAMLMISVLGDSRHSSMTGPVRGE